MKNNISMRIITSILAVVLILTAGVLPAFAVEHDPYLGGEYDYAVKGEIKVEIVDTYHYGGYTGLAGIGNCEYFRVNGNTAHCCWSNMYAPVPSADSSTKYYISNNSSRAKAVYYFVYASSTTPSARNEKIASGMPTTFLGKKITYYKDYIQAVTDYARANPEIEGEVNYNNLNDDVMAYIVSHMVMDDMQNSGKGFRSVDRVISAYSSLVYAAHKLVTDILYNSSVISNVPALPSNVKVFYCFPDRESGRNMESQGLMAIEETPKGSFAIQKESANAEITIDNSCYSLKDAEFTIYSDKDATKKVTTVTTNDKGYAEATGLTAATYYVKETKAPKGYVINSKIFSISVKSGDKPADNVLKVSEQPGNDPAYIAIFKNDPEHIEKDGNGNDVKKGIAGVEFELSYYDADPETTLSLEDLGSRSPKRTWTLKTDEDGFAALDKDWKVSGDKFYYSAYDSAGKPMGAPCVPIGCLTLKEIKTDPHYVIDTTVRFARVTEAMAENHEQIKFSDTTLTNDSIDYPNRQTTTVISKKSITTQNELPGASLKVTDKNGNIVDSWISTTVQHEIRGLTVGETYTLTETIAPDGYSTSSSIDFAVLSDGRTTEVVMYDDVTKYAFIKVNENGKPLKGAVMRLEEVSGDTVVGKIDEWTTGETAHEIYGTLIVGRTYKFSEIKAPNGYPLAEPITFIATDDSDVHTLTMKNIITKTTISKKSITTQEELPGAELEVRDKDGNIIDNWTSTDEEHLIEGLNPGETYTLTETIAPDGYVVTSTIEFTVNDDGTVTHVDMFDDTTKFNFIKVDENGDPVEGAVLRIEEFKGMSEAEVSATADEAAPAIEIWEPVEGEEWTTDKEGTPHEVIGKLVVGKRYRLAEVEAPKGYNLAAPVEFTVENNADPVEIRMVDTVTSVTKTDITGDKEVPGATLIVRDKNGNIVDQWISTDTNHHVENLIEGETYTLEEIIPAPGYVTAAPIEFTVKNGGISTEVTMKDAPTKIVVVKVDDNKKAVVGAKLQILDKNKKVIEEWTTDGKDHLIEGKLVVGETYTLHEVSAPEGYELAKDIEFTVKDTADEQTVTMTDVYTGGSKISTPDQPTTTTNTQVKTGQNTIGLMIALVLLVLSAAYIMFYHKKRINQI